MNEKERTNCLNNNKPFTHNKTVFFDRVSLASMSSGDRQDEPADKQLYNAVREYSGYYLRSR